MKLSWKKWNVCLHFFIQHENAQLRGLTFVSRTGSFLRDTHAKEGHSSIMAAGDQHMDILGILPSGKSLVPMLFSCHPRTWRVCFQTAALLLSGWLYSMADRHCLQDALAGTYFWSGYVTTFQTLNTQTLQGQITCCLERADVAMSHFVPFVNTNWKRTERQKKHIFGPGMTAGRSRRKKNQRVGSSGSCPSGRSPSTASEVRCTMWECETLTSRLLWTRPTAVKTHVNDILQASQQDNHVKLREPNAKTCKKIHFFKRTEIFEITNTSIPN